MICLSDTVFNTYVESDDKRIKIDGYNSITSDHPRDSEKKLSMYLL